MRKGGIRRIGGCRCIGCCRSRRGYFFVVKLVGYLYNRRFQTACVVYKVNPTLKIIRAIVGLSDIHLPIPKI